MEIRSEPAGAEVSAISGAKIGVTPLILEGDALDQILKNGRAAFEVRHPGYVPREVVLEQKGVDSHLVRLTPMDATYFSQQILSDYAGQINTISRDLLQIQGQIASGKNQIAQQSLKDFQSKYPNVAASYALQATIALAQGNKTEARTYLLRARALDPEDPIVSRMLTATGGAP